MGLIKEPKNVDFYVIDKPWTSEEKEEFSLLIAKLKIKSKSKRPSPIKKRTKTKAS